MLSTVRFIIRLGFLESLGISKICREDRARCNILYREGITMGKNKLQDTIYSYLVLYKNGITVEDVLANKDIFAELCSGMDKKTKTF